MQRKRLVFASAAAMLACGVGGVRAAEVDLVYFGIGARGNGTETQQGFPGAPGGPYTFDGPIGVEGETDNNGIVVSEYINDVSTFGPAFLGNAFVPSSVTFNYDGNKSTLDGSFSIKTQDFNGNDLFENGSFELSVLDFESLFNDETYFQVQASVNFHLDIEDGYFVSGNATEQFATYSADASLTDATGYLQSAVPLVPLPSAAPMLAAALLGLGAGGYGLKRMRQPRGA